MIAGNSCYLFFFLFLICLFFFFCLEHNRCIDTKLAFEQKDERYHWRLTARLGSLHKGERLRWATVLKDVPPHCDNRNRSDCSRNRSDCLRFCVGKS